MTGRPRSATGLAAVVAACAWIGLALQFRASFATQDEVGATVWVMLRYFTVITNLGLALTFSGLVLGWRAPSSLLGGVTLAILLVGVVYGLLLRDLVALSGGAKLADTLLHKVTPTLAPLFWLAYAPKGGLRPRDPWLWTIFPLAYFVYALTRGAAEGIYAYPFIDVPDLGWPRTGLNAVLIALGFVGVSHVALWLDRRLARPAAAGSVTDP